MNLTFAAQLNKMITAGLGGAVEAPETGVAVGRRVEYTSIGPAPILTFEANSELPLKALNVNMEPIQEGTGDPSPENVRPISGRSTVNVWCEATYDTSADPALTIPLGQTVYGGTVDAVSGVMTVDRAYLDMADIADWNIDISNQRIYKILNDLEPASSGSTTADGLVCNRFAALSSDAVYHGTQGVAISNGKALQFHIDGLTDIPNFTNAMVTEYFANNPTYVVAKLAQPVTVQLTAQQLTTLLGTNNVWSDANEVSLTYGNIYYTEGY